MKQRTSLEQAAHDHPELYQRYLRIQNIPPESISELDAIAARTFLYMVYLLDKERGLTTEQREMFE